ncbi:MAG: hypothetical protein WC730_01890 [Patescibacteria group bacterium]|jgi:hypothetical protein
MASKHMKENAEEKKPEAEKKEEEKAPKTPQEKSEVQMHEGLEAIYGDEKEKIDFTKLERANSRFTGILLTIIATLGVIAITTWLGFFIYMRFFSFEKEESFELTIETPEQIESGTSTTVTVHYKNPTTIPLATLSIEMRLPKGFLLEEMNPMPTEEAEKVWDLGSLSAGESGTIVLSGLWLAEVPSSTPIQAFANYRPSNFNADFQDIETVYLTTTGSVMETTMTGPEETSPGEDVSYEMVLTNASDKMFGQTTVELEIPNGFYFESSDPEIAAGSSPVWTFENLLPGDEQIIAFTGSFATDVSGFQYFDFTTLVSTGTASLIQHNGQAYTDVLTTDVTLTMAANGSTEKAVSQIGDEVRVPIALENKSDDALAAVSLLVSAEADLNLPIDWASASLSDGLMTSQGISWDSATIGGIAAGEKRMITITLPLKDSIDESTSDIFTLLASAKINGTTIRSSPITVSLTTNATFSANARYFDESGTPVGSGPLPPVVGSKTSYQVGWALSNSLHALEMITIETTLPPDISWDDVTTATLGTVNFDEETRKITWKITELSVTTPEAEATFMISATPTSEDIGTFVKLLSQSTFKGTDANTNTILQTTTSSLTTDLTEDSYAEGKGIVVE